MRRYTGWSLGIVALLVLAVLGYAAYAAQQAPAAPSEAEVERTLNALFVFYGDVDAWERTVAAVSTETGYGLLMQLKPNLTNTPRVKAVEIKGIKTLNVPDMPANQVVIQVQYRALYEDGTSRDFSTPFVFERSGDTWKFAGFAPVLPAEE